VDLADCAGFQRCIQQSTAECLAAFERASPCREGIDLNDYAAFHAQLTGPPSGGGVADKAAPDRAVMAAAMARVIQIVERGPAESVPGLRRGRFGQVKTHDHRRRYDRIPTDNGLPVVAILITLQDSLWSRFRTRRRSAVLVTVPGDAAGNSARVPRSRPRFRRRTTALDVAVDDRFLVDFQAFRAWQAQPCGLRTHRSAEDHPATPGTQIVRVVRVRHPVVQQCGIVRPVPRRDRKAGGIGEGHERNRSSAKGLRGSDEGDWGFVAPGSDPSPGPRSPPRAGLMRGPIYKGACRTSNNEIISIILKFFLGQTIAERLDRHYSKVHAFLYGLSGSATLADDLAQETFLCLLTLRVPGGRAQERYVLRVAHTCWARYLKNRRPTVSLEDVAAPTTHTCPQEALEKAEDAAAVRRCVARLSPEHREIVFLICDQDYTFVQASDILAIPCTTLVSRHQRALQCLKASLGPMME